MNYIQPLIKSSNYIYGKINPKTVGYVCKNGNINFATENTALLYAKNRVLKTLEEDIPCERGIVIRGNTIIADVKGNENQVTFKNIDLNNTIIVHGHPNYNYPISIQDVETFVLNNQKKIIAYNNKGEYSMVSRLPNSKFYELLLPQLLKEFVSIIKLALFETKIKEFSKKIDIKLQKMSANTQNELQKIIDSSDNDTKLLFIDWYKKTDNKEVRDTLLLPKEYRNTFEKLNQVAEFRPRAIRYFWQKNAEKYGLKYETNYTNKKPKKIHQGNNEIKTIIQVNMIKR